MFHHPKSKKIPVPTLEDMIIKDWDNIRKLNISAANNIIPPFIKETLTNYLCELVVLGKTTEAKEMLDVNPSLLFEKGTAKDYCGRTIKGSPLQCALGAEDFYPDMLGMMQTHIDKIDPNKEKTKEQLCEQFPELLSEFFPEKYLEHKTQEYKEVQYDFQKLVQAISKEEFKDGKNGEATNLVLEKFRKDFEVKNTLEKGKHFNIQLLIDARKVYEKNYDSWTPRQRKLFWCEVIGYLMRFLPTNYAQAYCKGLKRSVSDISERSLVLVGGAIYYPLDSKKEDRLGFDHAIISYDFGAPLPHLIKMPSRPRSTQPIEEPDPLIAVSEMKKKLFNAFKTWIKTPAQNLKKETRLS